VQQRRVNVVVGPSVRLAGRVLGLLEGAHPWLTYDDVLFMLLVVLFIVPLFIFMFFAIFALSHF